GGVLAVELPVPRAHAVLDAHEEVPLLVGRDVGRAPVADDVHRHVPRSRGDVVEVGHPAVDGVPHLVVPGLRVDVAHWSALLGFAGGQYPRPAAAGLGSPRSLAIALYAL